MAPELKSMWWIKMSDSLNKLFSSASPQLNNKLPTVNSALKSIAGVLFDDLFQMLSKRNGFYALESALLVFPSESTQDVFGINEWNNENLWREEYKGMADECLFFAEDVFGGQFCIKNNKIYTFDPETGQLDYLADDIQGWANAIISDYNVLTGYSLAHEWQLMHGPLPHKKRLLPKVPFVAGGEFSIDNLYLSDAIHGMRFRADIANQIKDLPDGAQIQIDIS